MANSKALSVVVALAAALGSGAAGWFLLRPGKAAAPSPGPHPGGVEERGPGGTPAVSGHPAPAVEKEEDDPTDDRDLPAVSVDPATGLDRAPSGEEGGFTTEEILAAAAKGTSQGWLDVERMLSVAGSKDPRVTELLLKTLSDPQFRNKAADLAKYLKDPAALARFLEAAKGGGDDYTRSAALQACANIGGQGVFETAQEVLRSARPGSNLAASAAGALGTLGTPEAARTLIDMLRGAVGTPQAAMYVEALARLRSAEALADMGRMANDEGVDARLRETLITALGRTGSAAAVPELLKAARGAESEELRTAAYNALGMVGSPEGVQELMNVLFGGDDGRKMAAAFALQNVRDKASGPLLVDALNKPLAPEMKSYLVTALGKAGGKGAVESLAKILKDAGESDALRGTAARSLGEIGDASANPALIELLETAPRSATALRSQAIRSLLRTAERSDLPRIEKLLEGAVPQSPEQVMLQGLVKALRSDRTGMLVK